MILRRSQFIPGNADSDGKPWLGGYIQPTTPGGRPADLEANSVEYASSNVAVLTVKENPEDQLKFKILWEGAGTTQITASGDSNMAAGEDNIKTVSGVIDITCVEDDANNIDIVIDMPHIEHWKGGAGAAKPKK